MWPRRLSAAGNTVTAVSPSSTGSLAALEHIADWVRFADAKATLLAAGLGVVVTMLTSGASTVVKAIGATCTSRLVVGGLAAVTVLSFLWTLIWVIRAITPRKTQLHNTLNRFAWPSLAGVTADELIAHAAAETLEKDAWQQVVNLAAIAKDKFNACTRATYGFGLMTAFGVSTLMAAAFAAT